MRIVLIGGNGFIGSSLANYLARMDYEVLVFDKIFTSKFNEKIATFTGNFEKRDDLNAAIQSGDCVIHLAATSVPVNSGKDITGDIEHNVLPSVRLFEVCAVKGVDRLIYASSGGTIYGVPRYTPIDEFHPLNPNSVYGMNKLSIENYLRYFSDKYHFKSIVLRISNPYGPRQVPFRGQGVISTFLASVLLNKPIHVWGDGSAVRDYLYIDDLTMAFESAIKYSGQHRIFNIGSGIGYSINQIIENIQDLTHTKPLILFEQESDVEVHANILNNSLAKLELNWVPQMSLLDGLSKTLTAWNPADNCFDGGFS
jgi:UDP-glucose 4-epimerase